ncbi:MAG: serine--tRNA ligase [Oscillospiraceae bacterium]|nr:serine--tRNA ligase [Oscillospiraceae bacterium]
MLDIKFIKDNIDYVKARLSDRNEKKYSADIDNAVEFYAKRNELIYNNELLKARQNQVSKEVPALKKAGKDTAVLLNQMKELSEEIKNADILIKDIDERITAILLNIPNLPDKSVPVGKDEKDNQIVRIIGEPKKFDFDPLPHWELGEKLGILDPENAAKVTGTRFNFYMGDGARLERAVINYFLDTHAKSGYTEVLPPFIVNRKSMTGTGQLPKFEEDAFKLSGFDYFLVPTAEVPVTNYHANEIVIFEDNEPKKYCAYTACFRSEAGSAGRDTRGLIRQHQFNKVELVKFALPENSYEELEKLTNDAEKVLQGLGFAYRVSLLCTGDTGFSNAKTYDLEVYMPSYGRYVEISSCSNYEDFQARRANIRYKKNVKDKAQFIHTLNGSGVAVGRTTACILENYQNADGTITVPEVLRPYMGGQKIIEKRRK